ncbi:outer membrane beta-barrel protein [Sphingomonas sp. M1A8_2b]
MKPALMSGIAFAVMIGAVGAPALAQDDQRGIGVADRSRPDYDPLGRGAGSFLLYPSVTARVDATDNYRATDANRLSDVFLTLSPEVRAASNWNRNRLNGRVFADRSVHARLPRENVTQYGGNANGVIDITRQSILTGELSAGHYVESRSSLGSFRNSREPVAYEAYHGAIGAAQNFNRLDINVSLGANATNFHDVRGLDGSVIDQDFRDYRTLAGSGSVKYDVGSGLGLILSGEANKNTYSFHPGDPGFDPRTTLDRQSSGNSLQGGLTFELSSLIFGAAQLGLLNRNYRDPRLHDFSGLSYNVNILWNVTPLTTVRFRAARSVEDTSSTTVAGNVRNDFSVAADHELYRYLILTGTLRYGSFTPNGAGFGGKEYGVGASARYLVDRHWSATLNARYDRRNSDSSFLRYHAATLGIAAKYAY